MSDASGPTGATGLPAGADVVVVGAGLAGLAVADELRRSGRPDTVVLESGPDLGHLHYRCEWDEETALQRWLDPESDPSFWRPYRTDGPQYLGLAGLRRRVGGRSLYWHGVVLPIEDWALADAAWPRQVVSDLVEGWGGGPSLYARTTADLAAWASVVADTPAEDVVLGEDRFVPTPQVLRRDGPGARWSAYSPLASWGVPPHDGGRVRIVADCHVVEVMVRSSRVMGVRVAHRGEVVELAATTVLLAAGTIENSRLAIQALTDCGALARPRLSGLVDKIVHGFSVALDPRRLAPEIVTAAGHGRFGHRPVPGLRSNQFLSLSVGPTGLVVLDSWLMGEQQRGDAGAVRCLPVQDRPWPSRVEAGLGVEDEEMCAAQQGYLRAFWRRATRAVGRNDPDLVFDEEYGSADLRDRLLGARSAHAATPARTYSFPLGAEQHEAGTTPLGVMLDDRHQFRAVGGLFAAGPSSFPRTGAANPSLTVLALARRLATTLLDAEAR